MKKEKLLFILAFILFVQLSQSQLIMIDSETGEYNYQDVITVGGISQQQIQARAKEWLDLYYPENDSIKVLDTSLYKTGTTNFTWRLIQKELPVTIFYDIEIKTKDNKYRYEFSNFREGKINGGQIDAKDLKVYIDRFPTRYQIYIEEPIDTEITKALSSLDYFILNGTVENVDDEW
jgi:hypothetical protein